MARFISEDPIGFAGGDANLYAYVFNQPTAFRDPLGHELVAGTYGLSGFAGVTTHRGRLSSVGVAGSASIAYGVSGTGTDIKGTGGAMSVGGVKLNGPATSTEFVMGFGLSKLGLGVSYSNADSFSQTAGDSDTTLIAAGPIGIQYDVSIDPTTGKTIFTIGVSPAAGLGVARLKTRTRASDAPYPCPHCPVEALMPGTGPPSRMLGGRK
jgi:hypothetical protein